MNNKIYPGYWFARDVMGAMLMVRENSISLLWELNSIFVEILQKQFFLFTTNIAALSRGCKPRIEPIVWCAACLVPRPHYCAPPMRFGSRNQSESPGHSSLIRHRNALTVKASVGALLGLSNCAATYVNEKTFESSDEMLWCVMIEVKPLQQYFPIVASWTGSNFKRLGAKFCAVTIQIKPPVRTLTWNVHVSLFHTKKIWICYFESLHCYWNGGPSQLIYCSSFNPKPIPFSSRSFSPVLKPTNWCTV